MPRDNTTSRPDLPELSDEDVAILYEIINVSLQSPELHEWPLRAIFAAYKEVLEKHRISPAHDRVYFRFLFRLGERLGQDGDDEEEKDLFSEFVAFLLELGIKIEIGSETGSDLAEDEVSISHKNTGYDDSEYAFVEEGPPAYKRERRASFSEVLDSAKKADRARRDLLESPASISRLQDTSDGFGSRPFREKRRRASHDEAFLHYPISTTIRSDIDYKVTSTNKQFQHLVHGHKSGLHEDFRTRDLITRPVEQGRLGKSAPKFRIYEDSPREDVQSQKAMEKLPDKQALEQYELLRAKMQQDAEILRNFHFQKFVRNVFRKWWRRQRQRSQLLQAAIQYDRKELIRQAWNELLHKCNERRLVAESRKRAEEAKRQALEQERYLLWREENAVRARDVYLVAKAFSHWANLASERVEENAVARRHLLRLRYFNAWEEVTAVNELKVRRAILKRFIDRWHQKFQDVAAQQAQSLSIHEKNLVHAMYLNWFRHLCEQKASAWRARMLAQKYFLRWVIAIRIRVEQSLLVVKHRQEHIQRLQLCRFTDLVQHSRSLAKQAEQFRYQRLISKAFSEWKQAEKLASSVCKVSMIVNRRVVSAAFARLKHRYNAEQQAQEIHRKRLLQSIWTNWNDNLRVKTMQHQMDDRLVMRVLYNWVIVERGALMRRVHDDRLQKQVLHELVKQSKLSKTRSMKVARQARQMKEHNLKNMVWRLWMKKSNEIKIQLDTADRTYQPRVKSQIMHQWHSVHGHLIDISRWSIEAAFYFRGQRSIKKWQAVAKESQSQKRREAYAIVKRAYHKNLAMRAFQEWRHRSSQIKLIQDMEQESQIRRVDNILSANLKHWIQRTANHSLIAAQAAVHDSNKLTASALDNWASRTRVISGQSVIAIEFYDSSIQKKAYDSLRRLQLKIFELQSHDATASSVLTWTSKRRARGLLRAWAERAVSRRLNKASTDTTPPDPGPLLPHGTSLSSLSKTPRTNRKPQPIPSAPPPQPNQATHPPLTPFYNPTNTPNNLSTPSRRAARAKALSHLQTPFSTTLPTYPQPPSQVPSTTTPPSDESSHQTTNTSPTQLSESRTTHDDHYSNHQPFHYSNHQSFLTSAESSHGLTQRPLQTAAQVPLTDVQPQRRRFVPAHGEDVRGSVVAASSARRSLFPKARSVLGNRFGGLDGD